MGMFCSVSLKPHTAHRDLLLEHQDLQYANLCKISASLPREVQDKIISEIPLLYAESSDQFCAIKQIRRLDKTTNRIALRLQIDNEHYQDLLRQKFTAMVRGLAHENYVNHFGSGVFDEVLPLGYALSISRDERKLAGQMKGVDLNFWGFGKFDLLFNVETAVAFQALCPHLTRASQLTVIGHGEISGMPEKYYVAGQRYFASLPNLDLSPLKNLQHLTIRTIDERFGLQNSPLKGTSSLLELKHLTLHRLNEVSIRKLLQSDIFPHLEKITIVDGKTHWQEFDLTREKLINFDFFQFSRLSHVDLMETNITTASGQMILQDGGRNISFLTKTDK